DRGRADEGPGDSEHLLGLDQVGVAGEHPQRHAAERRPRHLQRADRGQRPVDADIAAGGGEIDWRIRGVRRGGEQAGRAVDHLALAAAGASAAGGGGGTCTGCSEREMVDSAPCLFPTATYTANPPVNFPSSGSNVSVDGTLTSIGTLKVARSSFGGVPLRMLTGHSDLVEAE